MTMTGTTCEVAGAVAGMGCRRRRAGLVLAVLLLAGCPGTAVTPQTQIAGPSRVAKAIPPVPRTKPVPPPLADKVSAKEQGTVTSVIGSAPVATDAMTGPVVGTEVAAVPPEVQHAAKPPAAQNPDSLVGMDQVQIRRLLGTPAATEEAPPAKVWRYAKGDCTLKVFFFMDMTSSQDFRALSYDMKSSQNVPDDDKRCFAQLLAQAWDVRND